MYQSRMMELDFGVSAYYQDNNVRIRDIRGSPAFIPPEALQIDDDSEGYLPKLADTWALGAMLYIIIFGKAPFYAKSAFDVYAAILEQTPLYLRYRNNEQNDDIVEVAE
ncbi:MAG: hypothetical protein EZS28_055131, partial [Streblomastix strix]